MRTRTLRVMEDLYEVCRLEAGAEIPEWATGAFCSVTRTEAELSIVCPQGRSSPATRREGGFALLRVEGPLRFDEVGVVSSLAEPLASAGISIFVLSTFDTDYLLVKRENLAAAIDSLRSAGHTLIGTGAS